MFRKKIRRIFSIILAAGISVSLLSACEKAESVPEETTSSETTVSETTAKYSDEELELMAQDMPEIVFVKVYYFDSEEKCTKGYYIKNDGTVNYFELENENVFDYRKIVKQDFSGVSRYKTVFDLSEVLKKSEAFEENTVSIEEKTIDTEELKEYYKTLLNVDKNAVMKNSFDVSAVLHPQYGFYGIRFNDDGEREMLTLREYGGEWSISTDSYAENVYNQLQNIFPLISAEDSRIPIWVMWE